MHDVSFRIEIEPHGKGRPRFGKYGAVFTDKKTAEYEKALKFAAKVAMAGKPMIMGPVHLRLTAYISIPPSWSKSKQRMALMGTLQPTGKPDADNILKAVADAFNGVLWRDDAQVVEATVTKRYAERGSLGIIAREVGSTEAFDALTQQQAQTGKLF